MILIDRLLKYAPWAAAIVAILISLHTCNRKEKEAREYKKNLDYAHIMLNATESTMRRDSTKAGDALTAQNVLYLSEKDARELLLIENERLKKVKQEIKIVTRTVIRVDTVALTDSFTIINGDTVRSRNFDVKDEWYGLKGKVLPTSLVIDSMYTKDEYVVTTGYEPQGFLKKKILVVDVVNKNPYSRVDKLYNVTVPQPKKKWFETKAAAIGAGVVGGLYLSTKL